MSNQVYGYKMQAVAAIFGGVLALALGVAPMVAQSAEAAKVDNKNIKPVASVVVAEVETGPHVDKAGDVVFKAVCTSCHAAGMMGSPKLGDKAAWGPRVAQGYDTLVKNAIAGIRAMPAKGGNSALTDAEVANAVKYMANASGASFK